MDQLRMIRLDADLYVYSVKAAGEASKLRMTRKQIISRMFFVILHQIFEGDSKLNNAQKIEFIQLK